LAFGALAAGAQVVPINPFFTRSELEVVLREIDATIAICGADARDKLVALASSVGLTPVGFAATPGLDLSLALDIESGAAPAQWGALPTLADGALAVAIFTGGTTGEPKAVEHTHASTFVSVLQHCTLWPVRFGAERFLSVAQAAQISCPLFPRPQCRQEVSPVT